mgnify:CR=1 FL=1
MQQVHSSWHTFKRIQHWEGCEMVGFPPTTFASLMLKQLSINWGQVASNAGHFASERRSSCLIKIFWIAACTWWMMTHVHFTRMQCGLKFFKKPTLKTGQIDYFYFYICARLESFCDFLQSDRLHQRAAFHNIFAPGPKE